MKKADTCLEPWQTYTEELSLLIEHLKDVIYYPKKAASYMFCRVLIELLKNLLFASPPHCVKSVRFGVILARIFPHSD